MCECKIPSVQNKRTFHLCQYILQHNQIQDTVKKDKWDFFLHNILINNLEIFTTLERFVYLFHIACLQMVLGIDTENQFAIPCKCRHLHMRSYRKLALQTIRVKTLFQERKCPNKILHVFNAVIS